jgi:D-beta-D-heptose 7-phosphate kinase/D-beta-D-heptose 1-phosphate adenosyltransferase
MNLPSLQAVHVLVVGDLMLDRYWSGPAHRVSPEAPVPVVQVERVEQYPGGAANVALNIASLGARCTLIGVVGNDDAASSLIDTLSAAGVVCDLVSLEGWQTIVKLRVVSQNQQLLRTDFEQPFPQDSACAAAVAEKVKANLDDATTLVLQDYDKGVLDDPESLIVLATRAGVPVVVDPKHKPFRRYAGVDLLKPNEQELQSAVGPWADDDELVSKARALCGEHELGAVVITRGAKGMTTVSRDGAHQHLPALPVDVYDRTGAGDTAAAALAITTSLGWKPSTCAQVANVASGIVVGKSGTAAITGPELAMALERLERIDRGSLNRNQLADAINQSRAAGERIVFTNGCFDILHAGHVGYLEEARALGDRLVVAVNDDASVRRLKGAGRPINSLERRLKVLAGLAAVDWVVEFAEDTPEALLESLRPDVLVKGGDYLKSEVVGASLVTGYGGEVEVLSLVEDCSTTAIMEHIRKEA